MYHTLLLQALVGALKDCFVDGYHAEKVVAYTLKKNKKWGSRDRRFFAETFYELIRWWSRLTYVTEKKQFNPVEASLFFDDEARVKKVVYAWLLLTVEEDLNIPYFADLKLDRSQLKSQWTDTEELSSIGLAVPEWIFDLLSKNLPEQELRRINDAAPVYLRVNTQRVTSEKLLEFLNSENIPVDPVKDQVNALRLKERKNVFQSDAFKKGYFEVQDKGSQQVAPFVAPEPGMRVLDACAGAGGKSLHLAILMQNKGKIIASDIHEWKLNELRKRSSRNGIDIIETKVLSSKQIKRLNSSMDRLLLDVPCTGLGVLKRKPDTKWKLRPEQLEELLEIQSKLLQQYAPAVKVGGQMVYATCSVLKEENELQVRKFLEKNKNWTFVEERRTSLKDCDGFYMARLKRSE